MNELEDSECLMYIAGADPSMAAKARMRREMEQERKKQEEAERLAAKYSEPKEIVKVTCITS